jgi:hypothetical protein
MTSAEHPSLDELAAGSIDELDIRNLGRIAQMYATLDPVPSGLVERVQFGITLDALHGEIAELQRSGSLAGVRSDGVTATETVTFTSASLSIMVTITPLAGERARIDGWIAPGETASVELRLREDTLTREADEDGRFVFEDVPRGLAQFVVRLPGDQRLPVITPSIEI